MLTRREVLLLLGVTATAFPPGRAPAQHPVVPAGVDPERLARLSRGVNLSHWMWFPHARGEIARRRFITRADLDALARAGFTHVRLPFEPSWLWDDAAGKLRAAETAEYEDAARLCLDAGLAVLIDAHWSRTPWIRPRAATYEERFGELERMWRALAERMAATDPARVFLELVNEPHDLVEAAHWHDAQLRIAKTVRDQAPHHTIIATGADWGNIDGLLALPPLDDKNIVYSFHFYEPHNFSHQAAEWGFPPWKEMSGVPWPADRAQIEAVAQKLPEASSRALKWSAREGTQDPWNAAAVRARLERAGEWARKHEVPIYCGEFGVYTKAASRESRLAWHAAVAQSLAELRIGWALWDYVGGFHIATGEPGERTLDQELRAVLWQE